MADGEAIPDGKTCNDCRHYERCRWLLSREPTETKCDWTPSRFAARTLYDQPFMRYRP
jgi:hypothetical protein